MTKEELRKSLDFVNDEREKLQQENERLTNRLKHANFMINEIANKRIGYGQTDIDKWWLHELWEVQHYLVGDTDDKN